MAACPSDAEATSPDLFASPELFVEAPESAPAKSEVGAEGTGGSGDDEAAADIGQDNGTSQDIVPFDDGVSGVSKVQTSASRIAINYLEPTLAAGASLLGLGFLTLPFLAALSKPEVGGAGPSELTYTTAAGACLGEEAEDCEAFFSKDELRKRFGALDVGSVMEELRRRPEEFGKELEGRRGGGGGTASALDSEVEAVQDFLDGAAGRLRLLRRRAALALMGLPPEAGESDVGRVYKKMALELHPDKGGDPTKFQELQEARDLLSQDEDRLGGLGGADAKAPRKKRRKRKGAEDSEEQQEEGPDLEARRACWAESREARLRARDAVANLREQTRLAKDQLENPRGAGASATSAQVRVSTPQHALATLRAHLERVAATVLADVQRACALGEAPRRRAGRAALRRLVRSGAEALAVGAAADPQATLNMVAMQFNYPLVSACPEMKVPCARLLEALAEVRDRALSVAQECSRASLGEAPSTAASDSAGSGADPASPGTHEAASAAAASGGEPAVEVVAQVPSVVPPPGGPRQGRPAGAARHASGRGGAFRSARRFLRRHRQGPPIDAVARRESQLQPGRHEGVEPVVFEPLPIRIGPYELRLRMQEVSGGSPECHESVRAELTAKGEIIGRLRATYVMRERGAHFPSACRRAASPRLAACAAALLDGAGRPGAAIKDLVSVKATRGGLLILDDVFVEPRMRGRGLGLDFVEGLVRCLAGPMKRLTLIACVIAPGDEGGGTQAPHSSVAALERYWARAGFQRARPDAAFWILEPQNLRRRPTPALPPAATTFRVSPGGRLAAAASAAGAGRQVTAARPPEARWERPAPKRARAEPPPSARGPAPKARAVPKADVDDGLGSGRAPEVDFAAGLGERLTPRVYFALSFAVEAAAGKLRGDAAHFASGTACDRFWGAECFPPPLRQGVLKTFVRGMAEILDVIGALLIWRTVPTVSVITQVLSPLSGTPSRELGLQLNRHCVSHFFGHQGRVEYVIKALVNEASAFYEAREGATDEEGQQSGAARACPYGVYHALPIHMLDGDFDFVQGVLIPSSD